MSWIARTAGLNLVAGVVLSVAGLWILRGVLPEGESGAEDPNVAIAGYLTALATVYAVLLAFVTIVVWEKLSDARKRVEDEGNELIELLRASQGLSQTDGARLADAVRAYARAVLEHEQGGGLTGWGPAGPHFERIWHALLQVSPASRREEQLYEHALDRADDLGAARSNRLLIGQDRLHPLMWAVLIGGAVLTVGSMYLFKMQSIAMHAVLSGLLGFGLAFVLYLIRDLSEPFAGAWQLKFEPIERALDWSPDGRAADAAARLAAST